MRFTSRRLCPPYRLINYRPLSDLVSAQFLFDLYDQFDPRINVFRFRNVVGVYRDSSMYTYAPEADWEYLVQRIARGTQTFAFAERVDRLEQLFANQKQRLHLLLSRFDTAYPQLEHANNEVLCDWLVELYYQALNEIFVMNLVPLEAGYYRRLLLDFQHAGRTENDLLWFIEDDARQFADTTVANTDRKRLIILALAERQQSADRMEKERVFRAIQDHSVGYGAEARTLESIEKEFQTYLSMSEAGLAALEAKTVLGEPCSEKPHGLQPDTQKLLHLYTQLGSLRDRNKGLLGCAVRRRQQLVGIIAKRTGVPISELKLYFLEEFVELLQTGTPTVIDERLQGVVLSSSLLYETRDRAENTAALLTTSSATTGPLHGLCASAGCVEAPARIMNELDSVACFQPGEILVASGTDFHLLDAMLKAAAVVTVEGGILSHASVVCRERGIPCIVGVHQALSFIKTGDRLRVDAQRGVIDLLSSSSPFSVSSSGSPSASAGLLWDQTESDSGPVGNKSQMLVRIQEAGLRVAHFSVLKEAFFRAWLSQARGGLASFLELSPKGKQDCISNLPVEAATHWINEQRIFHGKIKQTDLCAVRSSAFWEDGTVQSYAGVLKSLLFVSADGEALAKAVKSCWSALFSETLAAYASVKGDCTTQVWYLPLIVQKMIPAVLSGVLFTNNPLTGSGQVVAEIKQGGCFEVTDGSPCDERLVFDRNQSQTQVVSGLLNAKEMEQLRNAVDVLCAQFGESLDVEWSFDQTGMLVIHQCRPITTIRGHHAHR